MVHHRPPLLLTIKETSRALGVGLTSTYRLINEGKLRTVKAGSDKRVVYEDVERLAREGWTWASPEKSVRKTPRSPEKISRFYEK